MEMTEDQIHGELDCIAMHLLTLSQDLIKAKLDMEEQTKLGFIGLAQSRNAMGGPTSVSQLQFPSEESNDFTARFKTSRDYQKFDKGESNFSYYSLEDNNVNQVVHDLDSKLGIQKRRNKNDNDEDDDNPKQKKAANLPKDPLKWFGVLVPTALRQTQGTFMKALELSIDCANIQSQIESRIARKNDLLVELMK